MKTFFIETYGCQMNKSDSAVIAESLLKSGFQEVQTHLDADIIIINTCSVRKSAESRIWGRLGFYKFIKRKKKLTLIVAGCMAQRLGEDFLVENEAVDIVIGTYFKDKLPLILSNFKRGRRSVHTEQNDLSFAESIPDKDNILKAYVTVSYGCNNYCSYCIVPYLRGKEVSRRSEDIITDVKKLADQGVVQVTLLGQNVNSYGRDNNDITFAELLKRVARETDIKWIKYISSHPKDFSDDLIEVIAGEEKISKWLHLALQSGSDKILEKMNRYYNHDFFFRQVAKLRSLTKKINLTTDIIVGFPGETDADFQATYDLVKELRFDDAFLYKYNPRSGTAAYNNFKDDVPAAVKSERLTKIIELQRIIGREKRAERVGDLLPAICEKWSKIEKGEILALTKDDIMIIFNGDQNDFGKIFNIRAKELRGNTLFGEKI